MANQNDNRGPATRFGIGPDDRTYVVKTVTIAAGGIEEIAGQFDWCAILAATADTIALSYNQGRAFQALPRGLAPTFPRTSLLVLKNTGLASSIVQVAYGMGEPPRDSRLVVVGGTQIAVQGIAGGVPVVVQGVAGMVPVATQDDPLPAVAMLAAYLDANAVSAVSVFTALANVRGAWIYFAELATTASTYSQCAALVNSTTGVDYLRAMRDSIAGGAAVGPNIASRRDRPWFVPAAQAVDLECRAAARSVGMVNYKLVP